MALRYQLPLQELLLTVQIVIRLSFLSVERLPGTDDRRDKHGGPAVGPLRRHERGRHVAEDGSQ